MNTFIWVRIGGSRQRTAFATLEEAVDYLNSLKVGRVDYWLMGCCNGIETPEHRIELYHCDTDGEIVSALLPDERAFVEEGLLAQFA